MGKFFQKLKNDCKGAVTVFVAMMLIPAVLISGSGVDIARIYVARSEMQDANQLAANSALASYDALLQDLYGLYGIMKTDDELASMMEEYIRVAVFGEDWKDRSMGTFSHFYGERSSLTVTAEAASGKNLENAAVLRRQIEEYAKFRAPAVIVNEVLDKLDVFDKLKEDAKVIQDKMEIDDKIDEIDKIYEKLYNCIQKVNQAKNTENGAVQSVNDYIGRMETTIDRLYTTRTDGYTPAALEENSDLMGDYTQKYLGLFENLHHLVTGGTIQEGYILGGEDEDGVYQYGDFTSSYQTDGLERSLEKKKNDLKGYMDNSRNSLKELLELAKKADEKRKELSEKVDALENKLNSGACSEELRTGMTETKDKEGKTYIQRYRELLSYNITAMAEAMDRHDRPQITQMIEMLDNDVLYGDPNLGTDCMFSLNTIRNINANQDGYEIDLVIRNTQRARDGLDPLYDRLAHLDGITPQTYEVPGTFELFQSEKFRETKNKEFYEQLKKMYTSEGSAKKKKITKGIEKLAGQIQDQYTSMLTFDPLGAWTYSKGSGGSGDTSSFGEEGDWSGSGSAKKQAQKALNDDLISCISNAGSSAANKLLLLTYDSEMFSCYATNDGYSGTEEKEAEEPTEKNMAGIPLGIKVNYYFQSELEYLYNGNLANAKSNLKAVTGMIFLLRFVMNYIASFTITSVNSTVQMVEEALAYLGPVAIAIGELVRLVIVLGEGVGDVGRLKNGCKVMVFKTNDTWQFSLTGVLDQIENGTIGDLSTGDFGSGKNSDMAGFVYQDYMRLLLLLVDGDVLAQRTAKLMELNVTNYKNKIGENGDRSAREQAMSGAELFDMSKAITDFSVTTAVNLKMLFLSSPVAQKGYVHGVVPPNTKELVVKDYRGY